jgi:hypothetical protein
VFFNDGNKDIVVTSISQALMKVDVQQRAGDLIRGIFGTTTVDAQKTPICNEQSENGLQEYYSDEQQKSQGAFVVKAGQFYIMSGATFLPNANFYQCCYRRYTIYNRLMLSYQICKAERFGG